MNLESFQEVQLAPCASFSRTFSRTETPSARAPRLSPGARYDPEVQRVRRRAHKVTRVESSSMTRAWSASA